MRRGGDPDPKGRCVLYWRQRSERGVDNHALNLAVHLGNALDLPVVAYFAGISNFPHGKIRYMSGASTGCKFDSERYITQMRALATG